MLQTPLLSLATVDAERLFYAVVFVLAVASRFWDLGARAISFDECTHAVWSYKLYMGEGYTHDPLMHGPFLFHASALVFFLFGDSTYSARIVPALFGVALVLSPLLLRRWLGRVGAMIASGLLLISPTILTYSRYLRNDVYMLVWVVILAAALFHVLERHSSRWLVAGAGVLMLSLATKENAYLFGFTGLAFVAAVLVWERINPRRRSWLALGSLVVSAVFLVGARQLQGLAAASEEAGGGLLTLAVALLTVMGGTVPAWVACARLIPSRHPGPSHLEEALRAMPRRTWVLVAAVMLLIYSLLFTGFFTNVTGLLSGIAGSISYWFAQQEVERGSQPWFYYGLLLAMYDFLPLLLGLAGLGVFLVRGRQGAEPATAPPPEAGTAESAYPEPTSGQPAAPAASSRSLFRAFLVFWTLNSLFLYAWAGERMPWMVVHQTLPLILLGATFTGEVVERARVRWGRAWARGGWLLALLLVAIFLAVYQLAGLEDARGLWLGLPVTLGLGLAAVGVARRLGGRRAALAGLGTVFAALSLLTVRFAWMAAYINYDYATELLVYAHGTPDVTLTMDEIAAISQRIAGDRQIEVAYDQEAAWPLEWYLREYPNRKFYGTTPTRESLDVPIVLASSEIDSKVRPFLGERYDRFRRRELWWPNQQYMDLSWPRVREILGSAEGRSALWDILFHRRYPRSTDDWYHVDVVYLYIRKDVAQQAWAFGAPPAGAAELEPGPYEEAWLELPVETAWGEPGTGPGQFTQPRGIAIGPGGRVYVVDSGAHRVQVFDEDGEFLRAWGSQCALDTGVGCVDPDGDGPRRAGDGQFNEPWGIAVSEAGMVYVADTWNHRIQAFDAYGTFLRTWGTFGETSGPTPWFYGPRDLAVGPDDQLYMTDTGNERILVYAGDGRYLTQWGTEGLIAGAFAEPVGLDVDAQGFVYVADTWNQRVQVFDPGHAFVREWPVEGWYGDSVVNKPYLAVDSRGRVYVTDPEGARALVFSDEGRLVAAFGQYGLEGRGWQLPTGIALDGQDRIYVTDAEGQRVLRFEPLP